MEFQTAQAFEHLDKLAYEIGPRVAGTRGSDLAATYITERLKALGVSFRVQEFSFVDARMRTRARSFAFLLGAVLQPLLAPLHGAVLWLASLLSNWWLPHLLPRRKSRNIVSTIGDPRAPRTVALMAHYDSAWLRPRGFIRHLRSLFLLLFTLGVALRIFSFAPLWIVMGCGVLLAGTLLVESLVFKSRPSPGANDNASGVAVLLTIAAALVERPFPNLRVHVVFTGAEEHGLAGSKHLAKSRLVPSDALVLNLDTVGYGTRPYYVEGNGMFFKLRTSRKLNELIARAGQSMRVGIRPWWMARARHDHMPFSKRGYQASTLTMDDDAPNPDRRARMFGIPNARLRSYRYLHTPDDLPDKLKPKSVERTGNLVLEILKLVAEGSNNYKRAA